ncbi:hypothetical protein [Erwinia tasmaniensis]|uniref:Uncharacterized protein n=1 Tax=Erwinia tasmaniensis (strain DSM 17950 / CFBP 7177 / CIP 109463 / NCPPB 4357 / Et1/99) TaxID=465817 RepID=B2VDV4_ERWT9|nr:hypothetical protein [Erwinia tasmaniensis]CAO95991.1 hypothetical protein ETA_09450 [Erwinia tasmaniensis Et1/99]
MDKISLLWLFHQLWCRTGFGTGLVTDGQIKAAAIIFPYGAIFHCTADSEQPMLLTQLCIGPESNNK